VGPLPRAVEILYEESTAPCAAGRHAAARRFLEVEAAELGGAVASSWATAATCRLLRVAPAVKGRGPSMRVRASGRQKAP
jgi:uncharacterized protein (DUF697 family)